MKRPITAMTFAALLAFLCCSTTLFAGVPKVQKFKLWGTFQTDIEKLNFFIGFSNGLFASGVTVLENRPIRKDVYKCILSEQFDIEQAIAMIDKYYKDHPEKWNDVIGFAIIDALTVKGGPCPLQEEKVER